MFSVSTPSASASTSAAAADGARPSTDPDPCSASQATRNAAIVLDLTLPAGPTATSCVERLDGSSPSQPGTSPTRSCSPCFAEHLDTVVDSLSEADYVELGPSGLIVHGDRA